ncbi:MAG: FAD-dependent oxidoreductase [Bacteroidetes bacterium]|nr:FAD-dependent oxidoreductase [Bacteroidota bacterium]
MAHIVIIGNGISGITTARHIRKLSDHRITVISSETEHFYSRTALMYIYMGHMKFEHTKPYEDWFWKKNQIDLVFDHVNSVNFNEHKLAMQSGKTIGYDKLVLAVGSKPNFFGWKGQELKGVQGLYSFQDLQIMEARTPKLNRAVVVGGGLIGIEMAEMFASRRIPVTFLVREPSFWNKILPPEESEMINNHIRSHHIDLRLDTELDEILDNGNGEVGGIVTKSGKKIPCEFVGVTVGVSPNIEFLKNTELKIDRGILINSKQETNIKNVYAVGDCAQHINPPEGRRPLEQIWYTGKIQGENCARIICNRPSEYDPGIFYNSAKFFDIEYQIYGDVPAQHQEGISSFFWQHESGEKSIRIVYRDSDRAVVGFNLLGIRYRHKICESWIRREVSVGRVIKELKAANFDPEFYKTYEHEFVSKYENRFGETLKQQRIKGLTSFIFRK